MPYRPSERQYRDFDVGSFQPEVQESSEDKEQSYVTRGYFCTFNEPYELFPDYYEEIDPQAFVGCDMSDVLMQVNHEGHVYARNRNGSLQITTDDHGGHCVADLSGSKRGREELFEAINNGLIDRMSFGFTIADNGLEWDEDEQGVIHTRITRISKLYDVSAIAGFPANPGTEISARSLHDAIIEARDKRREAEQRSDDKPEDKPEPAFTDEEIEAIANALERRAKERKAQDDVTPEEEEKRELPDFLKDDDDEDEDEKRDCQEDEEQRESHEEEEEQQRAARSRRSRRMLALSLIDI